MIRAYVVDSVFGMVVNISIVRHLPDSEMRQILRLETADDGTLCEQWDEIDPAGRTLSTLSLGHEEATALLAALHTHYQGVDDQRMLRKDYEDERRRVDRLIGIVGQAACGTSPPSLLSPIETPLTRAARDGSVPNPFKPEG